MGRTSDTFQDLAKNVVHDKENATACQGPLPQTKALSHVQPEGLDSAAGQVARTEFVSSVMLTLLCWTYSHRIGWLTYANGARHFVTLSLLTLHAAFRPVDKVFCSHATAPPRPSAGNPQARQMLLSSCVCALFLSPLGYDKIFQCSWKPLS